MTESQGEGRGPGGPSRLDCAFFRTDRGNEPVRGWLKSLPVAAKREIGSDIERVQWQWPVGKPLVDGLGGGLYEVRTKFQKLQYRVLFCVVQDTMLLLHGFVKKARTEPDDLALGRDRLKAAKEQQKESGRKEEGP